MVLEPAEEGGGAKEAGRPSLTAADLVVLSLLTERSMHGYELIAEVARQEGSDWEPARRTPPVWRRCWLGGRCPTGRRCRARMSTMR